jgi:hypothetical protein
MAASEFIPSVHPCPCSACTSRRQRHLRSHMDAFYSEPFEANPTPPITWQEILRGIVFAACFGFVLFSLAWLSA